MLGVPTVHPTFRMARMATFFRCECQESGIQEKTECELLQR